MSNFRNIIIEESGRAGEKRSLIDEITRKYILRIGYAASKEYHNSEAVCKYTRNYTVALDTMREIEDYLTQTFATAEKVAKAYDCESVDLWIDCLCVDCVVTDTEDKFLFHDCAFEYCEYNDKYVWYDDSEFFVKALDMLRRDITKNSNGTTDSGWHTEREDRKKARILAQSTQKSIDKSGNL